MDAPDVTDLDGRPRRDEEHAEPVTVDAGPGRGAESPARRPRRRLTVSQAGLVLAYVVVVGFFWSQRPDVFASWQTWRGILDASALPAIVAMGLTVTLIAGDFDLSFGATIGLSPGEHGSERHQIHRRQRRPA